MLHRLALAAAFALAALAMPAKAQTVQVVQSCSGYQPPVGPGAVLTIDQNGKLCADTLVQGTAVFRGGTIAAANTSQQLMPANPTRRGWVFQNQTAAECYWKIGGAATASNLSFRVASMATYETPSHHVSTAAINVLCVQTGGYYATEY